MMAILCLLGLVILPVTAAFRFNDERKGGEFNLLIVTGITPKRIVTGKMQASFIQMFIIVSVAAPFLVVCYLLRGVSIITILLSILGLLLISLAFMQSALFLGALKIPKFLLAILFFAGAWGMLNIVAPIFLLLGMIFGLFLNHYLAFLVVTLMFAGAFIAFFFPMTLLVLRAHRNRYTPHSLKERGLDVAWIDHKAYLISNKEDKNE